MRYTGKTGEYFEITTINSFNCHLLKQSKPGELSLLWFESDNNQFIVDTVGYTFNSDDIIFLTEFHKVEVVNIEKAKLLRWNKPFYCVVNHDSEVGCKGVLFFGAFSLPVIHPTQQDIDTLSTVLKMLEQEMVSHDNLQEEMLQMMLKRILILCTRMYKSQADYEKMEPQSVDIIRSYNFLVEQHFKEKHTVAEYADLLHKSPKTLSNLFKKLGNKSPLQFIQDRKMLEAKRLLSYTDKTISEIGYDLGFADVQSFSRFFKKEEGISPNQFQRKIA